MVAYKDWLALPMTREMLEMAEDVLRPSGLPADQRDGNRALYYSGRIDGAQAALTILKELEMFMEQQRALAAASKLEPTYGADAILAAQGRGE